jgi:hypothetical protein
VCRDEQAVASVRGQFAVWEDLEMTKANQAESARSEITPGAVLTSAVLKGAEIWMNAQGEVLSVMEAATADWMRRRREAVDTWSRSLRKMCECRNPADFVQTQQDWLCDAIRLATRDIRALAGDTTILTRKMAAGFEKPAGPDDDIRLTRRRPDAGGSQPVERVAAE